VLHEFCSSVLYGFIIVLFRPFGSSAILGGYDRDGPQLYMIEPSGVAYVSL
jgi:20S proteasome alpha/beta subunit